MDANSETQGSASQRELIFSFLTQERESNTEHLQLSLAATLNRRKHQYPGILDFLKSHSSSWQVYQLSQACKTLKQSLCFCRRESSSIPEASNQVECAFNFPFTFQNSNSRSLYFSVVFSMFFTVLGCETRTPMDAESEAYLRFCLWF